MVVELEDTENYFRLPDAKFKLEHAYNDDTPVFRVCEKKGNVRTEAMLDSFMDRLAAHHTTKHCMVINFSQLQKAPKTTQRSMESF